MKRAITAIFAIAIMFLTTSSAFAQEFAEDEPAPMVPYGLVLVAGGGVGGFTDADLRDMTGTAGLWEARVLWGTRLPVAIEAAYLGGMQAIDALGLDSDARLLATGVEGTLRVNFTVGAIQPYAFAGLGWTRFDLTNFDVNTSSVEDQDDVLAIPFGIGVAYRYGSIIGDLRGTYRPTTYEDLVPITGGDGHDNLDSWGVAAHVGFEF